MKRRVALQSILGASALSQAPLKAQQAPPAPLADDAVKLELSAPEAVAAGRARFFSTAQFAVLERLCTIIAPAYNGRPGAVEAEVAPFLDFLLAQSPAERQLLYAQGLEELAAQAQARYGKAFATLDAAAASALLMPLGVKWTWQAPRDPLARFLREAKNDILRATSNSRAAAQAGGGRRAAGVNTYWEVID